MLLFQILFVFESLIIQIFPDRLNVVSVRIINSFWWSVFMRWRSTKYFLLVFLRRMHYLVIGLKVLLLIKIHFLYNLFAPFSFYSCKQYLYSFIRLICFYFIFIHKLYYSFCFYIFTFHLVLIHSFDQNKE